MVIPTVRKKNRVQETRLALTNTDLSVLSDVQFGWPGLKNMGIVVSIRQEEAVAKESEIVVKYYVSSKDLNTKELLNATRPH